MSKRRSIRYVWRSIAWSIRKWIHDGWRYDRSGLILTGAAMGVLLVALIVTVPGLITEHYCSLTGCD